MAHLINIENGSASMAYVGPKPWHGLGQELEEGASIETWLVQAGMNYGIVKVPALFRGQDEIALNIYKGKHILYRDDNKQPLSVVGSTYKVVQPAQVLEFFRDLTEKQGFVLDTAGVLREGQTYWALARTGHELRVAGNDLIKGYVLLATSCDGTMATTAKFTSVRVVCNNTLQMADADGKGIKIYHSTVFDEAKVKVQLGLLDDTWSSFSDKSAELAKRKVTDKEAVEYLVNLLGDPTKPVEEQPRPRELAAILRLFKGEGLGSQLRSAEGTAWGLVNAITEYVDHHKGRKQDNRLESAWFYAGKNLKQEAFDEAIKLVA